MTTQQINTDSREWKAITEMLESKKKEILKKILTETTIDSDRAKYVWQFNFYESIQNEPQKILNKSKLIKETTYV